MDELYDTLNRQYVSRQSNARNSKKYIKLNEGEASI